MDWRVAVSALCFLGGAAEAGGRLCALGRGGSWAAGVGRPILFRSCGEGTIGDNRGHVGTIGDMGDREGLGRLAMWQDSQRTL